MAKELSDYQLKALSIDGTSSSLVICDGSGGPIAPALMYDDSQSVNSLDVINKAAPREAAVHSASSSLAKLLHLKSEGHLEQTSHVLHQAEWILGCLSREWTHGDENNALKLGYDPVERKWPEWLVSLLKQEGIPLSFLPEIQAAGSRQGIIHPDVADELGLPADLMLISGTTDSTAASIASGIKETGDATTSLGSTLVLKILSDHPIFDANFGIYSHRLGDQWLVGGASNSGGAVLRHYFVDQHMAKMTPHLMPEKTTGLDYYPLLRPGERFPINDPEYPARLDPLVDDPVEFFQGLLEGIARIEKLGYDKLVELGGPEPRRIYTTGGGAKNPAWFEIRQKLLGIPVLKADKTEAAYGSAKLAFSGYYSATM